MASAVGCSACPMRPPRKTSLAMRRKQLISNSHPLLKEGVEDVLKVVRLPDSCAGKRQTIQVSFQLDRSIDEHSHSSSSVKRIDEDVYEVVAPIELGAVDSCPLPSWQFTRAGRTFLWAKGWFSKLKMEQLKARPCC